MDLKVTGKFIAEQRKAKGLTQVKLAEKLSVSEKTISKWECGKGFPDTTLILPLCKVLEISANELLSAKLLPTEKEYKERAEQNLIELKKSQDSNTKKMLNFEIVIGYFCSILFLILIGVASYVDMSIVLRIILIVVGLINFIMGVSICLYIEKDAGFYECKHCDNKYVPTMNQVLWSMHIGRTRHMKCPKCGKRSWQKKVISND
ncbi:MAG: helix-turn-helix transcriptional regulator [Clostridia bacterium]|nr:helix-turn-helix transcriptional regulator [Clostridia bacterium]